MAERKYLDKTGLETLISKVKEISDVSVSQTVTEAEGSEIAVINGTSIYAPVYAELPDPTEIVDGSILVTYNGEWALMSIGLEDITEEEF